MSDLFISYASADREQVRLLASVLEQRNWSVWWDRRILAGQTYDDEIEHELEAAGAIVVLWSNASVASEWVRNEASVGVERGVLVPVLIDGATPPLAFRRKQTADLTGWNGDPAHAGFRALCEGIAAKLGPPSPAPVYSIPPLRPALRNRGYRKRLLLAAAIVAIGLAVSWGTERWRGKAREAAVGEAAGKTFLEAVYQGDVATQSKLLDGRVDLAQLGARAVREAADARLHGAQSAATEQQQLDTLALLLQRGVDVNARDREGLTPLLLAARSESEPLAAVKLLLERGADLQAKCDCSVCDPRVGSQGCTALMIAASRGHGDSVRFLLDRGARADEATDARRTALMLTTDAGVVRALLDKGAATDLRDAEGKTALMLAIEDPRASVGTIRSLLEGSANLDGQDDSGRTALSWASAGGRVEIVRALIARHVPLDSKTHNGRTALMLAALNGHTAVISHLARAGARLNERDSTGKTALQLAREQLTGDTRRQIVGMLEKAGAK